MTYAEDSPERSLELSPGERAILRFVQGSVPDSPTPFGDIAQELGLTEKEVLGLLQRLKEDGSIRRFGATLYHQEAGYGANVMVAWLVEPQAAVERVSRVMIQRSEITHCYERRTCPEWPYNLYTMIHGKSREDCRRLVRELAEQTGISRYELLFSDRELKKTSMRYF